MNKKEYRSSVFMHSDAEDIADRAVKDSMDYSPASRAFFLKMCMSAIAEELEKPQYREKEEI